MGASTVSKGHSAATGGADDDRECERQCLNR
jgi:hypothetical protein